MSDHSTQPATNTRAASTRRNRITGIDAARGIAILGMIATHLYPLITQSPTGESVPTWVGLFFTGNASTLFAVLAGVSIGIIAGKTPSSIAAARPRILLRALIIFIIGMILGALPHNIAIILVHYAVLFALALAFISLSTRALAWWTAGWLVVSPLILGMVSRFMQLQAGGVNTYVSEWRLWSNPSVITVAEQPGIFIWDLLFSGYYPIVVFFGFVLLGILIGRFDMRRASYAALLTVLGAAVGGVSTWLGQLWVNADQHLATLAQELFATEDMVKAWSLTGAELQSGMVTGAPVWFGVATPHSGAPLDVFSTAGFATATIGLCLLITGWAEGRHLTGITRGLGRAVSGIFSTVVGPGRISLTIYVTHVLAVAIVGPNPAFIAPGWLLFWHWAVAILLGWVFYLWGRRGPLEALTHTISTGFGPRQSR